MIPRILLFNDNRKAGGLTLALRRRGAQVTVAPLSAASFDSTSPTGLSFPGFARRLPDAVFVRSMAAGSFEAITRRLGLLHALGKLGVPVWNSALAIERCVDKSTTTFLFKAAGLPTPDTFAVEGLETAQALVRRELPRGPLVLKPLFGAQGRGIKLIERVEDLPTDAAGIGDVYYLQQFIARSGPPYADFRIFVSAGKAIAMMRRVSGDWITNVNRGASPERLEVASEPRMAELAVAAARAVGADFAGIDILADANGRLFVLEANSMPAWSGLQSVSSINIAGAIADGFLNAVRHHHDDVEKRARPLRFVSPANG